MEMDIRILVGQQKVSHSVKVMIGGCCVCSDERGWTENPLVYCDGHGCNVAVHQGTVKKEKEIIKAIPAFKHHYTTTPEKEKCAEKKPEKYKQKRKHSATTEASTVTTHTEYEKTKTDSLEGDTASYSSTSSLKSMEETTAKFTSANFTEIEFTSNKPLDDTPPQGMPSESAGAPQKSKKHSGQRGRKSSKGLVSSETASTSGRSDSPCSTMSHISQPDLPSLGLSEINANALEHRATPSDDGSSTKSKTKSQSKSSKEPSREPTPSRLPSVTTETIEQRDLPPVAATSTPPLAAMETPESVPAEATVVTPTKTYETSYEEFMMKYTSSTHGGELANGQTKNKEPTVPPITIVKSPDKHDKKRHRVKKNKAGHPGRPKTSKTVKDLIQESSQPSPTKKSRKSSLSSPSTSLNTMSSDMTDLSSSHQSGQFPPNLLPQDSLPNTPNLSFSQSSSSPFGLSSLFRTSDSLSGSLASSLSQQQPYESQLTSSNPTMPALQPENISDNQTNQDTRETLTATSSNGLLIGPQRPQSSNSQSNDMDQSFIPPFPATMEELLERQWEQGSEFLMQQGAHFDISSLLSCLHQLRAENQRLEDHIKNLVARRDHLLAVNARLSVPLANSSATATDNGPNPQGAGRSPRLNNMIPSDPPQAQLWKSTKI
uniref:Protein AF-10-like n=1 Tax=Saccoglossus kowalevskii TaxID=10224 RepID=A0ABM0MZY0_SACKO|nr:PREDICTED: protein AF-10-like [Saccoglossus kowalevskii]